MHSGPRGTRGIGTLHLNPREGWSRGGACWLAVCTVAMRGSDYVHTLYGKAVLGRLVTNRLDHHLEPVSSRFQRVSLVQAPHRLGALLASQFGQPWPSEQIVTLRVSIR